MDTNIHKLGSILIAEGIILAIFGFLILIWPSITLLTAIIIIGGYLLVSGVVGLVKGFADVFRRGIAGIFEMILGVFGIVLGVFVLKNPNVPLTILFYFIGLWFIIFGVNKIIAKTPTGKSKAISIVIGILSIIVGLSLFNQPLVNGVFLYWLLGLYALLAGAFTIVQGLSLVSSHDHGNNAKMA